MVLSFTDDFQITWADPARAGESWVHDRLHAPWAQPPLTQALFDRIMAVAFGVPTVFVNSYGFMRNFGPPRATPEVEARGPIPIWDEDFEPHVRLACLEMRNRDYEALSTLQLAERLPQYFEETAETFHYTTVVIFAFMRPTAALINFLEAELGTKAACSRRASCKVSRTSPPLQASAWRSSRRLRRRPGRSRTHYATGATKRFRNQKAAPSSCDASTSTWLSSAGAPTAGTRRICRPGPKTRRWRWR